MQDSFVANLLRLIEKMKPSLVAAKEKKKSSSKKKKLVEKEIKTESDVAMKKALFPGLALPNNPCVRVRNAELLLYCNIYQSA